MINYFLYLSIGLFLLIPSGCAALMPVSRQDLKDEVVLYRLVEPLFNADQTSRIMRLDSGSEAPQAIVEKEAVCIGCHAFSAQGHIALNVKKSGDRRLVIFKTDEGVVGLFDARKIGEFSFLAWSPDSRYLAMAVNTFGVIDIKNDVREPFNLRYQSGDIAIYDVETKEIKLLPGASEMDFVEDMPAWSPDGKELLFVRYKSEKNAPIESMSILRVPFNKGEGGAPSLVVEASGEGDYNYFPTCSPDGKWISFVKGDGSQGVFARPSSDIYIVQNAGGKPKKLALNTEDVMDSWHRWSKDSRWITFSSKQGDSMTALYVSTIDSKGSSGRPVLQASHKDMKVNIPELSSSLRFPEKMHQVIRDMIAGIYSDGI